ncbi:HPr kinase/phosphorylase [Methylobacterium isbiliense]|uniref:HPr kinase/phosphorylase n=1 Tax=Methylobacterium isbiliense TaxID=315478 RepID=A0ABQ4SJD1_9HYPH|nr:HPr kinase/phosphatase C-terminal domain-containing protein [Methylobacterium isbiliense]MDN3622105.1 HPr kinase/phosphatase C-terminal domain-containing protein [Methylobacterium isbiliense]GJE03247.1 HPr kinase/phosphorylase [Methylobacterium isbiliense]
MLGEVGILIRGASGSGKTTLARDLLDSGPILRCYAALVGDDRIGLDARHGRLIARPHPLLAGLVEIRGFGPQTVENTLPSAVVRLVADLAETAPRMTGREEESVVLLGIRLPRIVLPRDPARTSTVLWRWRRHRGMMVAG